MKNQNHWLDSLALLVGCREWCMFKWNLKNGWWLGSTVLHACLLLNKIINFCDKLCLICHLVCGMFLHFLEGLCSWVCYFKHDTFLNFILFWCFLKSSFRFNNFSNAEILCVCVHTFYNVLVLFVSWHTYLCAHTFIVIITSSYM